MKWLAAMALGVALIAPAQADDKVEICITVGDAAAAIMQLRQKGMPLATMIATIPDNQIGPIIREMILEAYADYPQMHTSEMRQLYVNQFRDDWLADCLQEIRGDLM